MAKNVRSVRAFASFSYAYATLRTHYRSLAVSLRLQRSVTYLRNLCKRSSKVELNR